MGGFMKKILILSIFAIVAVYYGLGLWAETKTVWVPEQVKGEAINRSATSNQEIVDMNQEDPITLESFADLAQAKFTLHRPYIIARVEAGGVHHYYDAHELNHFLFGFLGSSRFKPLNSYQDIQRIPITRLDYFILNNADEQAFTYLCSYIDLMLQAEQWRDYFYRNQSAPLLSPAEQLDAARGIITFRQQDSYRLALDYLRNAADQKEDFYLAGRAQAMLGDLYFHGLGDIPKDFGLAAQYCRMAVQNPSISQHSKAQSWLNLGKMYQEGSSDLPQNYAKAYECYLRAAEDFFDDIQDIQVEAQERMATIARINKERILQDIASERAQIEGDGTLLPEVKTEKREMLRRIEQLVRRCDRRGACTVQ